MIIYGLRMQGRKEAVPKAVAAWLLDRNFAYPKIDFEVNCREGEPAQQKELEESAHKYSRVYFMKEALSGVSDIIFPYVSQVWSVKIIGGLDKDHNIVDRDSPTYNPNDIIKPLTLKMRDEIAGLPDRSTLVTLSEKSMALPRGENDPLLSGNLELVSLPPDFRWTSEVAVSGQEFSEIMNDPKTNNEAIKAIGEKDWEKLKFLRDKHKNQLYL